VANFIGDQEIVFSQTLLLADYEMAKLSFPLADSEFAMTIEFRPNEGSKPIIGWEGKTDHLQIIYQAWKEEYVPTATLRPVRIAQSTEGKSLFLRSYYQRTSGLNRLDLQVTRGDGHA
jgi:hypothetical protein